MAIEKRQPGEAKAAAAAGTAIGQGQKAVRQEAQAIQQKQQQVALKAREASEQRAMQWELEKMQMRSQQDFEQELRTKQFSYDKENRAREWDIEKLSMTSQLDFEREEKERQRKMTVYQTKIDAMDKSVEDGDHSGKEDNFKLKRAEYERHLMFAEAGDAYRAAPDVASKEREAGRYKLTQEAAGRSKEAHEKRMSEAGGTEREQLTEIVGSDLGKVLNLAQLREEAAEVMGKASGEVEKPPTAEKLKSMGTRAAYERGKKLGYWN